MRWFASLLSRSTKSDLRFELQDTNLREGLAVGMRSMPGNRYDGHTLAKTVEQVSILIVHNPRTVIMDKGYGVVEFDGLQILRLS